MIDSPYIHRSHCYAYFFTSLWKSNLITSLYTSHITRQSEARIHRNIIRSRVSEVPLLFGISFLKVTVFFQYVMPCCKSRNLFRKQRVSEEEHNTAQELNMFHLLARDAAPFHFLSRALCLALLLSPASSSLPSGSLMSYQHHASRGASSRPIIVKLHQKSSGGHVFGFRLLHPSLLNIEVMTLIQRSGSAPKRPGTYPSWNLSAAYFARPSQSEKGNWNN